MRLNSSCKRQLKNVEEEEEVSRLKRCSGGGSKLVVVEVWERYRSFELFAYEEDEEEVEEQEQRDRKDSWDW